MVAEIRGDTVANSDERRAADAASQDPVWEALARETKAKAEAKATALRLDHEYSTGIRQAAHLARLLARGTPDQPLSDPDNIRIVASDEFVAKTLLELAAAIESSVGIPYFNKQIWRWPMSSLGHRAARRLWELAAQQIEVQLMTREVAAARRSLAPYDPADSAGRGHTEAGLLDAFRQFERQPELIGLTVQNRISRHFLIRGAKVDLPPKVWAILGETPDQVPDAPAAAETADPAAQYVPASSSGVGALARATTEAPCDGATNYLRCNGTTWSVCFQGTARPAKASLGLRYLAVLVQRPGEEVGCATLVKECGVADRDGSALVPQQLADPPGIHGDHSAEPIIDEEALRSTQVRRAQLQERIAAAEETGNAEAEAEARDELQEIERYVSDSTRGGRVRREADPDRLHRNRVCGAIGRALDSLDAEHPELAVHLRASVRFGARCKYLPAVAAIWLA